MSKFFSIGHSLLEINRIKRVDLSQFKSETVLVTLDNGNVEEVVGFDALDLIWKIQPSWLEGKPYVKWNKHAWAIHNLIAHPLMQILAWCKLYKYAIFIHDITVPKPVDYKNGNTNR